MHMEIRCSESKGPPDPCIHHKFGQKKNYPIRHLLCTLSFLQGRLVLSPSCHLLIFSSEVFKTYVLTYNSCDRGKQILELQPSLWFDNTCTFFFRFSWYCFYFYFYHVVVVNMYFYWYIRFWTLKIIFGLGQRRWYKMLGAVPETTK